MGPQGKLLVSRSTTGEEGLCGRALLGGTGLPEMPWLGSPGQLAPRHHIQPQDPALPLHYQWSPPGLCLQDLQYSLQVGGMRFVLDLWGQRIQTEVLLSASLESHLRWSRSHMMLPVSQHLSGS